MIGKTVHALSRSSFDDGMFSGPRHCVGHGVSHSGCGVLLCSLACWLLKLEICWICTSLSQSPLPYKWSFPKTSLGDCSSLAYKTDQPLQEVKTATATSFQPKTSSSYASFKYSKVIDAELGKGPGKLLWPQKASLIAKMRTSLDPNSDFKTWC